MAIAAAPTVRVKVPVSAGETVTFVCRRPTAAETNNFLNSRFETFRGKVKSKLYAAREAFMDRIAIDIEGAEYVTPDGTRSPLNAATLFSEEDKVYWSGIMGVQVKGWKEMIPISWKSSAAQQFEDGSPEVEDEDSSKN